MLPRDTGDFDAPEIARRKDENSGVAGSQRSDLQRTISQPLILRQHNPAPPADRPKPDTILFIASEMVIVNLNDKTSLGEFRSGWFYAERPSMKKTVSSGDFAADGFFDRTGLQKEVLREIRDGIAGLVLLVDG